LGYNKLPILNKDTETAIVNITSNVTFQPLVVLPTYSDSKAALHSHSVALRYELAKNSNIKLFEVMPSLVDTEATKDMGGEHGIAPIQVAEAIHDAIINDQYEIYVGDTAVQREVYFNNPTTSLLAFNKGL